MTSLSTWVNQDLSGYDIEIYLTNVHPYLVRPPPLPVFKPLQDQERVRNYCNHNLLLLLRRNTARRNLELSLRGIRSIDYDEDNLEELHVFWSLNEEISRYYSDNLYAVSIKEDTAYLCLHFTRYHKELKSNTLYPEDPIHRIEDHLKILEDIERGPYYKKPLIRRIDLNLYETDTIGEPTMEEYMTKIRDGYGSGIARPEIDEKAQFELKGQFIKELRDNTFSGSDNEDVNEHIEKVLEIVDLFHIPNITQDQVMLRAFPMSLTGAVSRWLRNEPSGSIITWEALKKKFLSKCCPPARTAKKWRRSITFNKNLMKLFTKPGKDSKKF
ncbi:hypothetical protein Tco_1218625 [Tanacetum coccineum]